MKATWVFISLLLLARPATGQQDSVASDGSAGLLVTAGIDSALVLFDGEALGYTPLSVAGLPGGRHAIRILHPDLANWNAPVIDDSLVLVPGESVTREYRFENQLMLLTDPSGAEVIVGGKNLGRTPLLFSPSDSIARVRKDGFLPVSVPLGNARRGNILLSLERDSLWVPDNHTLISDDGESQVLPLVLSGVSTIIAGGFSAYFKVQADKAYGDYLLSGDPVKLAQTRKLDNVAGIALAASEIYFALFSYLLMTQ